MTQCCHHLHESINELVASHRVSVFGFVLVLLLCLCFGFVLFAFAACLIYDDDGLLDYVQVLHQFSFVASIEDGLESQFAITAFAMSYSVLNDLTEAMKALDEKTSRTVSSTYWSQSG